MCGRYTLTSPHDAVAEYFETGTAPELTARYNLAPSQESLIVTRGDSDGRRAQLARWGFPLSRSAKSRLAINARSENAGLRPAFKDSFAGRRCLVPANGFFEWVQIGRTRQPYYFTSRQSSLLGLAGLWAQTAAGRLCYVILTTEANEVVRPIHSRMPVILKQSHHAEWLQRGRLTEASAAAMMQPWPAADTRSEAVAMRVNDVSCDEPECLEPLVGPVDLFTN